RIEWKAAEPLRPWRRHEAVVAGDRRRARDQAENDSENERSLHREPFAPSLTSILAEPVSRAHVSLRGPQGRSNPGQREQRLDCFVASLLAMTGAPYLSSMKRMAIGRPASAPPRPLLNGKGVQRLSEAV